jgi:hypothetical protein
MARATHTTLLALVVAIGVPAVDAFARVGDPPTSDYPTVQLWITQRDLFARGDPMQVWFEVATDAHVTVFRVDTDGRIRVLFPLEPGAADFVRGGQRYEILPPGREHAAFVVDDYPGTGYLFALASMDPLDYGAYLSDEDWDFRVVSRNERIHGDPYVALTELVERIVPEDYTAWTYDLVPYLVEQRDDSPASWDPYRNWCGTFRQAPLDDPFTILTAGFPAMEPLFWYPPITAPPVHVAPRAHPGATRTAAPPPTAPRTRRSRGPLGTVGRIATGSSGGTPKPAAARGGHRPAPRARPATVRGGGRPVPGPAPATRPARRGTAPKRTVVATGPRPRR